MNFLLDVSNVDITKPIEGVSDKLAYGGQMLLIGLATVFSVLIILWFTLILFKFFFHDLGKGKKTKEVKTESAPTYQSGNTPDEKEIVAVITAAIAMAESECAGTKQFRVVSFRRK